MGAATHINRVEVAGCIVDRPRVSHESHGEEIYTFSLSSERLSHNRDILTVNCPRALLEASGADVGDTVMIEGELRSFNNRSGQGSRLIISVFARSIALYGGEVINRITLSGALCKPTIYRRTPLGREICDIMLAVNRRYGKSDYIPCIAWGSNARALSELRVGDSLSFEGRVQSREYVKVVDGTELPRRAYEVSVIRTLPAEE